MKKSNLTSKQSEEEINKILNEIFDEKKKNQNKVIVHSFCITQNKWIDLVSLDSEICSNPECVPCGIFNNAFKEEFDNFLNKDNDE